MHPYDPQFHTAYLATHCFESTYDIWVDFFFLYIVSASLQCLRFDVSVQPSSFFDDM